MNKLFVMVDAAQTKKIKILGIGLAGERNEFNFV